MLNDIRYAWRSLAKTPAVTLVVVLCLGLGVGANTTIFSFTNALFLRPLPVNEPDRLVRVYSGWRNQFRSSSFPEYTAVKAQSSVFAGVAAYRAATASVGQAESTTMEQVILATGDFFQVVGITPAAGRFFTPEEDRRAAAQPVAVVSHAFWRDRLSADPMLSGRTIQISGRPYTIVGVAPANFFGLEPDQEVAAWLPFMSYAHILGAGDNTLEQGAHSLGLVARLRPGVRIEAAQSAASAAAQSVVAEYGSEWKDLRLTVLSGATLTNATANPEIRVVFILLNAVVGFVLLIACANIANVLLARGMNRRREISIRLALGSGRLRLMRQLLVESVLLGLAGGLLGLLLTLWGADLLRNFNLPDAIDPSPDWRVLVYTLAVAVASGIIFGFVPALQATRVTLADTLKQSTRMGAPARSRLRGALVVSQISLSVLLLALAGLFLRAIFDLRTADSGFDSRGMLAVQLDFRTLNLSPEQGALLADRIQNRISALPGVQGATLSTTVPSGGRHWVTQATLPEHEQFRSQAIGLSYNVIGPDYLKTLGVPLVRGRALSADDGRGQPRVAVVNQAFVRQYFSAVNPLGKHIRLDSLNWAIVGVMGDVRYESAGYPAEPTILLSYHQQYEPNLTLQLRARGNLSALIPTIRRELNQLHSGLAGEFRTFEQIRYEAEFAPRMVSTLLSIFGALALLLASIGLYGVTAYVVTLRTHEIGVRMALGAQRRGVLGLVLRQGVRVVAIGGTIGLIFALAAGQLLRRELYGISAFDPFVLGAVTLLMGGIALVANLIPARRAAAVDPVVALRSE